MYTKPYIGKWIAVLYRTGRAYFDYRAEEYGISSSHVFFLLCLYRKQGISQNEISKNLNLDKGTTARIGSTLEEIGYVTRQQDLNDKRAYQVYLTEKGIQLEPNIRLMLKEWAHILTNDLTVEEEKVAYQLLQRLAEKAIAAKNDNWNIMNKL